ncbi:phage baseplate protein [Yokenella regensburgei]|uniref:phage baseplate protein n=1 Tax=Yokenella regensburgei TaxID=158877 RepID=UPI003EDA7AAD
MSDMGGLNAPAGRRAVIVSASGVSVSLRLRKRENYSVKRSVSQGALETGYKISDGTVTEQPEVTIEGLVTGSDGYALALDPTRIDAEVASINNAFNINELVSVYTSFIAVSDAVLTEFSAEATPKDKTITIKLSAKKVKFVNFQRTQNEAPAPKKTKTKNPAGKGRVDAGKKSATPEDKPKTDILYFTWS